MGQNGKPIPGGGPENKKRGGGVERLADVTIEAGAPAFVRLALKGAGSDADRYRLRWSTVPAPETTPGENGTETMASRRDRHDE